jgi:hypothetical protein
MLHICRRSLRNDLERDGTGRDATGYLLPTVPGGYEVRARFCWEFRTARRGFDSRRLHTQDGRCLAHALHPPARVLILDEEHVGFNGPRSTELPGRMALVEIPWRGRPLWAPSART